MVGWRISAVLHSGERKTSNVSEQSKACPVCGTEVPAEALGGLCPRCLLDREGEKAQTGPSTSSHGSESRTPTVDSLREWFPDLEIIALLGAGGMGAVYQARQPRLDRFVALKILSCPAEHRDDFALRFEREAQLLAKLNHPNIVTIHDFGEVDRKGKTSEADNLFFILMEFVDGADLQRLIRTGSLEPEQALRIVPQICDALQYAHDQGITHRDIKPANILVDVKGSVRIADFGLAKLVEGGKSGLETELTVTGASMGTPHYMAPEQWEAPERVDHRADIYSLGVVFYEMLTGERPHGVFDPPSKKSPQVDRRIDTVVLKAMEREIERRYQQASEVKEEMARVGAKTSESTGKQARDRSHRKRVFGALLGVAVCVVILVLAIALDWIPKAPQPMPPSAKESVERLIRPHQVIGRLRGVGTRRVNGEIVPIDLTEFDKYSDFVQVAAVFRHGDGSTMALRENGEVVANRESLERDGDIALLAQHAGATPAYLDRFGQSRYLINSKLLPDGAGPFIDLVARNFSGDTHGIGLLENGSVLTFGPRCWTPPEQARNRVRQIAAGGGIQAALLETGTVVAWNGRGAIELPAEFGSGIEEIGASETYLYARHRDGEAFSVYLDGTEFTRVSHGDVDALSTRGFAPMYRTADGNWHFFRAQFSLLFPDLVAALPHLNGLPAEAFSASAHPDNLQLPAYLVWIESDAGAATASLPDAH